MTDQTSERRLRALIARARESVGTFRDATREGRVLDFRKRDPLVMTIHEALDACEAALLSGVPPEPSQEQK